MKNPFHVMIIPTLGCPSKCKYCWSSEEGSPVMSIGHGKRDRGMAQRVRIGTG